jgi:ABC-type nitrate/sulfonate/bicarbonate transport system permease component
MLESVAALPRRSAGARGAATIRRHRRGLIGGTSVALFLAVWQLLGSQNIIRSELISYPTQVLPVGAELAGSGELGAHAIVSLQEFVYGFLLALALGMLVGFALGQFRRLRLLLEPLTMALYTTPRIALIPVLVIWFGIGIESKTAIVFLGAVFPILVNTMAGIRQIDVSWVRAARSFGASELQVVAKVALPGALPAVMAGIRLGIGRALIGVIVGEMYVSVAGVGRMVQVYGNAGRATELIALVTIVATFGFLCIAMVRWLEERVAPWRQPIEP